MPEASQYKEAIIQAITEGEAKGIKPSEIIDGIESAFPISRRTVERYYQGVKKGKYVKREVETQGGSFATITSKQPAPIIFTLLDHRIELEPDGLYESYLLYLDLKQRCQLSDSFTDVLRDGVGLAWQILASKPIVDQGEVIMEVTRGRSPGQSEE